MPTRSNRYKLEYFTPGSVYSAKSDYRRFTTLDYNLKSYVGIVGVGVISGWAIKTNKDSSFESLGDLDIVISYGNGIINGYFAESPYYVKRRTHMDIPDREIEVLRFDKSPEPYMTAQERLDYISVIQDYDPSFVCPDPMENTYVKTVLYDDPDSSRTSKMSLSDNTDTFIYATFPSGWKPYPQLADDAYAELDVNNLDEPQSADFASYDDYLLALAEYQEKMEAYNAYKWQLYTENHFTEVVFEKYNNQQSSSTKVLLGVITTRNGKIQQIDISKVDSLENLEAAIKKKSVDYITKHIHGGSKDYDPAKINLETDIRECILNSYDPNVGVALFDVQEKYYTSLVDGHKHSFIVDSSGNGQTVEHIGDGIKHFHTISNYVVSQPLASYAAVASHTHTIPNAENYIDGWTEDSLFNVYANKKLIGYKNGVSPTAISSNLTFDLDNKQIKIKGGVGIGYKTLACEFTAYDEKYSFSKSTFSAYSFMLFLIADYYSKFSAKILSNPSASPISSELIKNPSNSIDLMRQSQTADKFLFKTGDKFVYVTPVANNIEVIGVNIPSVHNEYKITIEILGNSEVTGVLKEENVFYVHADKFISGEFDIARIPFVSHIGRLNEKFSPYKLPMASQNGYRYQILPYVTGASQDHYHTIFVDMNGNGYTIDTMIGEDAVIYADGKDGKEYNIEHSHEIKNYVVLNSSGGEYDAWRATYEEAPAHSHSLERVEIGNGKTIYSVCEDSQGNLWMGTSDGLILKPLDSAYEFTINGQVINRIGNDLWALLKEAAIIYQSKYNLPMPVSDEYEESVYNIQEELTEHGQYSVVELNSDGQLTANIVMIKRLDYITFSNMYVSEVKQAFEVTSEDIVAGLKLFKVDSGLEISLYDENLPQYMYEKLIKVYYTTQRNISFSPYWNIFVSKRISGDIDEVCESNSGNTIETEDINILSANTCAFNFNINADIEKEWNVSSFPAGTEILNKSIKDKNGNTWILSNDSIFVARKYMVSKLVDKIENPSTSISISDIVEDGNGDILVTTNNGIYRTSDQGKTWLEDKNSQIGFLQIVRDFTADITDGDIGHRHSISVNRFGDGYTSDATLGVSHVHLVSNWVIQDASGHSHTIETTLYAIEADGTCYRKFRGSDWEKISTSNLGEFGKMFAFNGYLFVSNGSGLQRFNGNNWEIADKEIPFSFSNSFDGTKMFVGYYNKVKSSSDGLTLTDELLFSGQSQAFVDKNGATNFGYSTSNRLNSFYFNDITIPENQLAIASMSKWLAEEGGWDNTNVDLYFNEQLCYSSGKNIDKRGETVPNFSIDSTNGIIDFSAETSLTEKAETYSSQLMVKDASKFNVGDTVLVYNGSVPPTSEKPDQSIEVDEQKIDANGDSQNKSQAELISEYESKIDGMKAFSETAAKKAGEIKAYYKQYFVFSVEAVGSNSITVSPSTNCSFDSGCLVSRLMPFSSDTTIKGNIFSSHLYDSGTLTHSQLEDKASEIVSGAPYKLGNVYFSNILQLTQAVRYAYPTINQFFKNANFYDMHYTDNEMDDSLPYIENYIDTYNSFIHTKAAYDSGFTPKKSSKINCIYVGKKSFSGLIFAGTDMGLMWTRYSDSGEENWVYSPNMSCPVYSIRVHLNDKLMIGTENGLYISENLTDWTRIEEGSINFSCRDIKLRWDDSQAIYLDNVAVTFLNYQDEDGNAKGLMLVGGDVSGMQANRALKVEDNSNNIVGVYVIESIESGKIYVKSEFDPIPSSGTYNLSMALWWGQFDGETNINTNLTNPMIASGYNGLSVALYPENLIWQSSEIQDVNGQFVSDSITPISSGSVLARLTTINDLPKSLLIKSTDSGNRWKTIKEFRSYYANVVSFLPTNDGHSKIVVEYENGETPISGLHRLQTIKTTDNDTLYSIIWNEFDGENSIYVYGTGILDAIKVGSRLFISNIDISCIEEFSSAVYIGTDAGLWSDNGSLYGKSGVSGIVTDIGYSATIKSFGVNGMIKNVSMGENGNAIFTLVDVDKKVYKDELSGNKLYIRNIANVFSKTILSNSSDRASNEIYVELDFAFSSSLQRYIGRSATITSQTPMVYLTTKEKIESGELEGGTAYIIVSSSSKISKVYNIKSNGDGYIELGTEIDFGKEPLIKEGNRVILTNKNGELILYVSYDKDVIDMSLSGMTVIPTSSAYARYLAENVTIKYNEVNKLLLNKIVLSNPDSSSSTNMESLIPFLFEKNSKFLVNGAFITPLSGFEFGSASLVDDHYHNLNMIGETLNGEVTSISNTSDSNYLSIQINNISGFDNPILAIDEYLMDGESVLFTKPSNPYIYYKKKIKSISGTTIIVEKDGIEWNLDEEDENLISVGWNLSIDAKTYGMTEGTYYNDFQVFGSKITQDISVGANIIYVETTSGFSNGDKVKVIGVTNKSEENVISSVIDATRIQLMYGASKTYQKSDGAYLKLLTNSFANTHTHKIRKNRVESVNVSEYHDLGYSLSHSHETLPYIKQISDALSKDDMFVCGSSSKIYTTTDGMQWKEYVDLNNCTENGSAVNSIQAMGMDESGYIIAGADDMHLYYQHYILSGLEDMEDPDYDTSSSSSSSN